MLAKAVELAEKHGWFLCRQFENEANANIHSKTTAIEILEDFADDGLDYWVTGFGTGGTLKGVGRVLKERSPGTKVVVCEPDNSPVLGSGIAQPRESDGSVAASHPQFRPHLMQGWSPDFIAKLTEDAVAGKLIDDIIPIDGQDALKCARDLARKEGIFAGITGGATLSGALQVAASAPEGSTILCMLPDTGERYLTTTLFEDVPVEMTGEEVEISESTPLCRFGTPPTKPKVDTETRPEPQPVSADAEAFLDEVLNDKNHPVVIFALEWCEFCWSARKMFKAAKIDYRSVDLDSVEYQDDNWGGKIRTALTARTDIKTIPQIFVGGELVGGATELFDAYKAGEFQKMLESAGVSFDSSEVADPYEFLPTWLHPR
jgi:cysteine synthase A